jgi:DNA repair protein RadD
VILRDYQLAAVDAAANWATARPSDHGVIVLPTGAGKTAVMSGLVQRVREADSSARLLILAHRKELLQQSIQTAWRMMPASDVGIYAASLRRKDRKSPLTVASIQSLLRDPYAIGAQDVVLIDECHLVPPDADTGFRKTLAGLHAMRPDVRVIGLTATPYRLGSGLLHTGENSLFKGIIYEVGIPELLQQGYLCPVRPKATHARLSTAGVAVRGDFVPAQLSAAVDIDSTTQAIVAECVQNFQDRHCWLVFGCSVEHAEHLAAAFNQRGIPTEAVHGTMTDSERDIALSRFRSGALRCVVTCELLTTGFDHPAIDAIALVRPTKSAGLFYQMCGRGFRPHPSKIDCLVLDFAGNTMRHGPLDTISERIKDRAPGDGMGVAPAKECPNCEAIVPASALVCPHCEHQFPAPKPKLEREASTAPLLSSQVAVKIPEWHPVNGVVVHETSPRDVTKRPTLRVDYLSGPRTVASEWVCFSHPQDGYAYSKARQWWRERFGDRDCPVSAFDAAVDIDSLPEFYILPSEICVAQDGEYQRVAAVRWPGDRARRIAEAAFQASKNTALPKACWTCAHLDGDGRCTLAAMVPPPEVQAVGCEMYDVQHDAEVFAINAVYHDEVPF